MKDSSITLDPESESRCESLRRALSRSNGFGLFLVLADGEARAEVVRRLSGWSEMGAIPSLEVFPTGAEGVTRAREESQGAGRTQGGWLIPDGDALVEDQESIEALNLARDQLWRVVGGPLVVVLAPGLAVELQERAVDLYEIRRGTWQLRAVAPQRMREITLGASAAVDVDALRTWLRELDDDEREGRGQPSSWVDARLRIAAALLEGRAYGEAEVHARRAESSARTAEYHSGVVDALLVLGRLAFDQGNIDEALAIVARAEKEAEGLGIKDQLAPLLLRGDIEEHRGNYTATEETARKGIALAEQQNDVAAQARFWSQIAWCSFRRGDSKRSLEVLRSQVIARLEATDEFAQLALAWKQVADIRLEQGFDKEAEELFSGKIIPLFERGGWAIQMANATSSLADVYQAQGRLDEALRLQQDVALPIARAHGSLRDQVAMQGKIADVLAAQGRHIESIRLRRREVVPNFRLVGDRRGVAVTQGKIAMSLGFLKRYEEAIDLLVRTVIPMQDELGAMRDVAVSRLALSEYLRNSERQLDALSVVSDVIFALQGLSDLRNLAHAYWLHSRILMELGRSPDSVVSMEESLRIAVQIGNQGLVEEIRPVLDGLRPQQSRSASRHRRC